ATCTTTLANPRPPPRTPPPPRPPPPLRPGHPPPPPPATRPRLPDLRKKHTGRHDRREHVLGRLGWRADQHRRRPDPVLERDRTRHAAAPGAGAGDAPHGARQQRG